MSTGEVVGRRVVYADSFPTKLFMLASYLEKIGDVGDAENLVRRTIPLDPNIRDDHEYAISIAYGYEERGHNIEGIDVFSARFSDQRWDGNPMIDSWTYEDGVWMPREKGVTCETGAIVLGAECRHRRDTPSKEIYMRTWADIDDIFDDQFPE